VFGLPPAPIEELKAKQKALELLELVGLTNAKARDFINALRKSQNFPYGDQRRLEPVPLPLIPSLHF